MKKQLNRFSFGIGDRFGKEGESQLSAFVELKKLGLNVTPVWNKSHREHKTVGTDQSEVRKEADQAVSKLGWKDSYLVDADHITYDTVDGYLPYSEFYTIDVSDQINEPLSQKNRDAFVTGHHQYLGSLQIKGIDETFDVSNEVLESIGDTFYHAMQEALRIYQKIEQAKPGEFISVEISMDEVENPQNPLELYFILLMASELQIPINTIALKFTGDFYKGIDYRGDIDKFRKEFEQNLHVIRHCVNEFNLPENLKLSVHTGSDKFALYPIMNELVKEHDAGLHLKTAGTTWLEELIGLAEAGGTGLEMAKEIYRSAYERFEELTVPYENVLDVAKSKLPPPDEVDKYSGEDLASKLKHNKDNPSYSPDFRQLLHTGYKIAAEKGEAFQSVLQEHRAVLAKNVQYNLLERHLKPLFL